MTTLAEYLTTRYLIAEGALQGIADRPVDVTPIFTDGERLQNYWNGYRACLDDIRRFTDREDDP
jgi:hypothetical protein